MMKKRLIGLSFILLLSGCVMSPTDTSERGERVNPHPVRYDNKEKGRNEPNNDQREVQKEKWSTNKMDSYTDPTITETTEEIVEVLLENKDIIMAEVHETEDQMFVAVKLRGNNYKRSHQEDVIPDIEERVRQVMGPDEKQIVIWTDHIEWNEFKNDGARSPMLESINNFFGLENN